MFNRKKKRLAALKEQKAKEEREKTQREKEILLDNKYYELTGKHIKDIK